MADLDRMPIYRIEQAIIRRTARRQAKWVIANKAKAMGVLDIGGVFD